MKKAEIKLETLTCPSCIKKIETALANNESISSSKVLFNSSKVKADFDETKTNIEEINKIISKLGYTVLDSKVLK